MGVTGSGVPLGGECGDMIVRCTDETGSSSDVVVLDDMLTFTPGSIAELKKFIADFYFIDLSTAAAGYELKFGNIEYHLSQGTVIKVTGDIYNFCMMGGTATSKNVVLGKIRRLNEDMKTFCKAITRCWHLLKPYLERLVMLSSAGKKRPLQENSESVSEGKKLKASNDAAVNEHLDSVERQCLRCITQQQNFASHCEKPE
ncbi:hypothetical protein BgiBS90_026326 [Biomphalaria glabrata]|nr:hypothetical protein BgiBS90_026326 [Biomphalaria glabrata]